jgi:hypothetical protein
MGRVRRLVVLPVLIVCAFLAFEMPAPSELWSDLRIQIAALDRGPADDGPARRAVKRISQSGRFYGDCSGMMSAVMLFPEPCNELWRERLVLLARSPESTIRPLP